MRDVTGISLDKRVKKNTARNRKIMKGRNLTDKGKHKVRVVDQPLVCFSR